MNHPTCLTRRHFLPGSTLGIGGVALSWLLHRDGLLAAQEQTRPELERRTYDLRPRPPHHEPKARRVIHLSSESWKGV